MNIRCTTNALHGQPPTTEYDTPGSPKMTECLLQYGRIARASDDCGQHNEHLAEDQAGPLREDVGRRGGRTIPRPRRRT